MAAGTNPPRVMQTMASNGPLSARRQANARASRWNWSQETGKDLRDVGWTMMVPNLERGLPPTSLHPHPCKVGLAVLHIDSGGESTPHNALGCPNPAARRHSR